MDGSGFTAIDTLRIVQTAVYRGPHIYGDTPMVRIRLALGALEEMPSDRIEGFADRLVAMLPSLFTHACSLGREGGFLERVREGTWLGHVAEHVAIELQSLAGARVKLGKTRSVKGQPGVYDILFEYEDEAVGLLAGALALRLVNDLLPPRLKAQLDLDPVHADAAQISDGPAAAVEAFQRLRLRAGLGPTTASIVAAARAAGIPVMRLDKDSLVQLGWGARQKKIRASITSDTSHIAVEAACDKQLTRDLLSKAGLPVPTGTIVYSEEEAVAEAQALGWPVVLKPLDGNHGRGVTTELMSPDAVAEAFRAAAAHGRRVIVEKHFQGFDHRLLVINGELVAAARRMPAYVTGDGRLSIRELVEAANKDPRRGDGHEKAMTRIQLNEAAAAWLARSSKSFDTVPLLGEHVCLAPTANLSTGGEAIDCTDDVHPDNAAIAVRAALTLGLDIAGIDLICPDITRSVLKTGGGIVEVNAAPGFRMHLAPSHGRARDVGRPVVDMLFPKAVESRIPVFAVTGTNGKSTVGRMLAHILRHAGYRTGLTSTSGVYINGQRILKADASGPRSAKMVLQNPMVDAAVFEIARGGLLREGLPFDVCDIGAVTNVAPDHLGLKGIETIEDLAWVKSVVIENVRQDGISVLNADDLLTVRMRRRAGGRIAYVSMRGDDPPEHLKDHIDANEFAVVLETSSGKPTICIYRDGRRLPLIAAADIPATLGGVAAFNVSNAMTAAAMAIGHGVAVDTVRLALGGFGSAFEQNPGRLNIHDAHGFRVVFDYAHNSHGLTALSPVLASMRKPNSRQIGMITIPGDRRDIDIREMGATAARNLDEIIVREDRDNRGRADGDVMRLLKEGALSAGADPSSVHCIADEFDAAGFALNLARPGDLVLLCPTDVDGLWEQVLTFKPDVHSPSESAQPTSANNAETRVAARA